MAVYRLQSCLTASVSWGTAETANCTNRRHVNKPASPTARSPPLRLSCSLLFCEAFANNWEPVWHLLFSLCHSLCSLLCQSPLLYLCHKQQKVSLISPLLLFQLLAQSPPSLVKIIACTCNMHGALCMQQSLKFKTDVMPGQLFENSFSLEFHKQAFPH